MAHTSEVVDGEVEEVGDEDPVHDVGAQQHQQAEGVRHQLRPAAQQRAAQSWHFTRITAC